MRAKIRLLCPLLSVSLLILSCSIFTFGAKTAAQVLNLPASGDVMVTDDEQPDVTDRVARISYLKGEAKIRRLGSNDWERVTLNLPLVEGDELVTDEDARLEIQFNSYTHVRVEENSYLKIATLRDEGIALSISLGTMNARLTKFDKDKSFFEIDAPKTTIAVQRSGSYRVDAGEDRSTEIRVAALNGGEARVYSDNSGFTLKNNRSTRIFIDGPNVGEWETTDAIRFQDDFDTWTLDRDDVIARRMRDAYYDRYYDNDIYGADDLDQNGDWVYLRNYGYVWRPSRASIAHYADWSPYRYGHWRWMPPYGWIWVNDEPWGWATYHHGRWFYDAGYWYWSPYGHYRPRRSWWYPALVVINIIRSDVYWYPAGYYYSHRDCRWRYYRPHHNNNNHWGGNGGGNNNGGGGGPIRNPTPTPPVTQPVVTAPIKSPIRRPEVDTGGGSGGTEGYLGAPVKGGAIPSSAVVTTKFDQFGTVKTGGGKPPLSVANSVLAIKTDKGGELPQLPVGSSIKTKMTRDIVAETPPIAATIKQSPVKVGATVRTTGAPLDNELQNTKVLGGRPIKPPVEAGTGVTTKSDNTTEQPVKTTRDTGAVVRTPPVRNDPPPVKERPVYSPPPETKRDDPPPVKERPTYTPPPQTKREDPPPVKQPSYNPPPQRYDPPPKRNDPPPPPPPKRDDPPPKRNDPPPAKREDPPPNKKDGR